MLLTTTTTTKLPTGLSLQFPNCTIGGEGPEDNPEHCLVFYDEKTSRRELDCCWTADYRSVLPAALKNVVTVHPNATMYGRKAFILICCIY